MCKSKLKQGSYVHLKQTGQRGKFSSKLTTWVWNGFWPFKTQRNARKVLVEAKFKSYYLFQAKGTHFKIENMEFLHGQWVSLKFPMNFKAIMLIFELSFSLLLMSLKFGWPKKRSYKIHKINDQRNQFQTQPLVIDFSPKTRRNEFQRPPSNSKHFVLN